MYKSICSTILFALAVLSLSAASAKVEIPGRKAFLRNEKNAVMSVRIQAQNGDLADLTLTLDAPCQTKKLFRVAKVASGKYAVIRIPIETRLTAGTYPMTVTVKGKNLAKEVTLKGKLLIGKELHDQMVVLCWGYYPWHHRDIQKLGFTHATQNWFRSQAYRDEMLLDGFRGLFSYGKAVDLYGKNPPMRINNSGLPYGSKRAFNAAIPSFRKYAHDAIVRYVTREFSESPAVEGGLICTEIRDATNVSFDKYSKDSYKKFSGKDYPQEVREKDGVNYRVLKNFPLSRVVPADDPILNFYKWFWKDGDGWNLMYSAQSDAYKKAYKTPSWTFHDPAVRVPPVWGSGGNVDYISHWTYANPDPINIGVNTAEMHAMAKGNKKQQVMNMTQIIMYRSAAAPMGKRPDEPLWAKKHPKARYITLPPDMMQIAVWTQISRHVQGIMFHGLKSLLPYPRKDKPNSGYTYTNTKTADALADLLLNVVKPLGPALKKVPERKAEVAILESFASSMFAGTTTWGWTGWPFDLHLGLLWANLAPEVIYDETIIRDGLGNTKVLILPGCEVLTEPVYKAIVEFQKKGGIVVADKQLVPGITPDILIDTYKRVRDPRKDKAALQKIGLEIRKALAGCYTPFVQTSDPDIVTWVRSSGDADYLFMVNDKRTYGDYLGVYKLILEKTVPTKAKVSFRRKAGAIYDLRYHKEVPFTVQNNVTHLNESFTRKDIGKVYLVLPEKIGQLQLALPGKVRKGTSFTLKSSLSFVSGKSVKTPHPIRITVKDAAGVQTEDTTSAALVNGSYTQKITIPLNGKTGKWSVSVQDLASGKSITKTISVY